MGGALVLNYVCGLGQRTPLLAGIISSSPYLQPTMRGAGSRFPSTYNRLGKWYPNVSVGFRIQAEELTRDLGEMERVLGDGLIRDSVSLQCLGDMIYQGQKVLKKRWKKFPAPLPILLLHGTNDPICSYQATQTLSSQLLKLQPSNFRFKSWKDNMHDPHWDLDANAVRSEYTTWIRNNCRHFDKLPLEPSMVHWDSIRSSRSAATSSRSTPHHSSSSDDPPNKGGKKDKKTDNKREKQEKEERKRQEKLDKTEEKTQQKLAGKQGAGPTVPDAGQDGTQVGGEAQGTVKLEKVVSTPASAEPEVIQDLDGLRRQQEISKQKAIDKRREYNLDPSLTSASEAAPETAGHIVDEQHQQQQAGQVPSDSPAPPLGDRQQHGVIPTVITELCTPTTSTPPHLVPLPITSPSSLASQQDPTGLQSTISHPVVKEQTEMEKSLEVIAQTLSRHNSLNRLSTATTATAVGISGFVSLPALDEATSMSRVELAVDTTSSVVAVDVHDAPTAVAPSPPLLEVELPNSTALQPPASITNAEDIVETTATIQAEEIIPLKQEQEQGQQQEQGQEQGQGQGYTNTPDSVVHVDYSPEAPSSSSSIEEEAPEQVAPAESLASPECATSHPGQFPSPTLTPTVTITSIVREAPTDSKIDDIIAS
ncbi:hypothetical protein KI688_009646 [Linnemannia hyalina]|uniref:Serine aminopeptidase S33 domain-containing protein n=1 Tax=Linnemannia hyalina TaxID=64524 RepID=A0A9P7XZA3_9FUNG|nr:hypothetical protein KI688_009646 [Linnemannia hyalina]